MVWIFPKKCGFEAIKKSVKPKFVELNIEVFKKARKKVTIMSENMTCLLVFLNFCYKY